jgi:hypothetical protein
MSDDGSETYRFDPTEFRESDSGDGSTDTPAQAPPPDEDREFDWRGWTLVGMLFLAFGVIPLTIYYIPRAQNFLAATGLGYRDAFLFLPLIPAVLLGVLAVWATTRP